MHDPTKKQQKEAELWVDKSEISPDEWEIIKHYEEDEADLTALDEETRSDILTALFDDDDTDPD